MFESGYLLLSSTEHIDLFGALRNSQVVLQLLFQLSKRENVKLVDCIFKSFRALLVRKIDFLNSVLQLAITVVD